MVRFISIGCTTAGLMALLSSCNPDTQTVSPSNKPTVAVPANAGTADAGTATPENAAPGPPATGTADPVSKKGSGLEASGLLVDATVRQRQKVSFAAGESSAKASNGVIRGELDVYDLGASGGQQMVLSITSEEDNAVFTVVSPNGDILAKEAKNETFVLPDTGDYHVIVGGTRGNASYDLTIGIQGTADPVSADPVSKKGSGLEASGLIEHATAVHRKEVSFAAGKSSATVSNGVVRGHQDVYDLRASGGQKMNLSITSTEDNAVFHLVSPSGDILAQEARNETIVLPDTGDYHVIVGGTRGNASYDLTIGIQ